MELVCQQSALVQLSDLAASNRHSVLIEGPAGCGKSYLARQYARLVDVLDYQVVAPKVDAIKEATDLCTQLNTPIVLCIENLDTGVPAASYALLKFLEEPLPNVYIVVTCRSVKGVPDTIVSRSAVVVTSPPIDLDVSRYAISQNSDKFNQLQFTTLWRCVRTFNDADIVLSMTDAQLSYFHELTKVAEFKDSVSNLVWTIGHYPDNSPTPVELVIRYLMELVKSSHIQKSGIECIRDLMQKRLGDHAVLARFVFENKYCE